MKKTIALIPVLVMCVSLLSGCMIIYPQLKGGEVEQPTAAPPIGPSAAPAQTKPPETGLPETEPPEPVLPEPSADVSPAGPGELRGFTTNLSGPDEDGFSLAAGESWQMRLTFDPADWSGEVTYSVSDARYATVSADGNVVNVNQDSNLHRAILTITAGGITKEMPVYCYGVSANDPPTPNLPATQAPATGQQGIVINAADGLNVRSGPGSNYDKIGILPNGATVTVLEDVGSGWYRISFSGVGGAVTEGYVMSGYISID